MLTRYEKFILRCLYKSPPELSHTLSLQILNLAYRCRLSSFFAKPIEDPYQLLGLTFKNRVGLAAGFDKNGDYLAALNLLGFGWLEIGTVTPLAQLGNDQPRLFRYLEQQMIINRMGFNNKGCDYVAKQLERQDYQGVLGINIGKNKMTPLENAHEDYITCFRKLASFASYITINISSPNTENLRDLQSQNHLTKLLAVLKNEQAKLDRYVPLIVKVAPDLTERQCVEMVEIFIASKIDAIIATNTTISRPDRITSYPNGGVSGKPLTALSNDMVKKFVKQCADKIPIIASGGVMNSADAQQKILAGAKLVQLYSGLVFAGPSLVANCAQAIKMLS